MNRNRADAGFLPDVPYNVQCVDVWPSGTLTPAKKAVYDVLARKGEIIPKRISRDRQDRIYVVYMAQIPHEWIKDLLRKTSFEQYAAGIRANER